MKRKTMENPSIARVFEEIADLLELREDNGELAAAQKDQLPNLVRTSNLRGDLHCHTTTTDGQSTIREMAEAARRLRQYLDRRSDK